MTGRGHYITSSSEGGQFQKITHGVNKPFLS